MADLFLHEDFTTMSDFVGSLVSFINETEEETHGTIVVEKMNVALPLSCSVITEDGLTPTIYVAPPERTETGIQPVSHSVSITVEAHEQ